MVSGQPEGYSAVARGSDRKRIIRIGSALALLSVCHDSIGPVPVNSGTQSKPQGLTAPEDEEPFSKTRCEAEPSHVEPGL